MCAVPRRYVQLFDGYDKKFVDKVRSLVFYTVDSNGNDSAKPVLCVFATPERAFAQVAKQIARREKREINPTDIKNIPLPIVSITRGVGMIDHQRYVRYWYNAYHNKMNKYISNQRPLPYTFTYTIDIWTRELQVLDDLTNQAMTWLRANEFWLEVPHLPPIGNINVLVELDSITDNSILESETEQRALRRTLIYKVYGWLCYPIEQFGVIKSIVEKIIIDYYIMNDITFADISRVERDIISENENIVSVEFAVTKEDVQELVDRAFSTLEHNDLNDIQGGAPPDDFSHITENEYDDVKFVPTQIARENIENDFNAAYSTAYHEITYDGSERVSVIDIWENDSKTVKLFTKTFIYVEDNIYQITIFDEKSSLTLRKTFAYNLSGDVISITKEVF